MSSATTATGTKQLRCVVVTPERQVLDEPADYVVVPLYDGELGVLPGRQSLIGQLGAGAVRFKVGPHETHLFVDGGFVQVRSDVVTVLTPRAIPAEEIDVEAIHRQLEAGLNAGDGLTGERMAMHTREIQRARAQLRVAEAARRASAGTLERSAAQM